MAQFTIYRSTDASAPTLSGTAGDLTNLLDKCLVTGYGSQVAAGWSTTFTATNKRVYRSGAGTQLYVRINDAAAGTGGAKEALIRGAESWSDIDTPTNPFPTNAQSPLTQNSLIVRKSITADATTRAWILFADNKTFYLYVLTGDVALSYFGTAFGDFDSYVSGDVWNCLIRARAVENSGAVSTNVQVGSDLDNVNNVIVSTSASSSGIFSVRPYTGAVGSQLNVLIAMGNGSQILGSSTNNFIYPNSADNSIYLSSVLMQQQGIAVLRGKYRGLWNWLHNGGINDGDTFNGAGDLTGKTFIGVKALPNGGVAIMETSNTLS